jgi:hypothetical protein
MSGSIAQSVREIKRDLGSFVAASQIIRLCQAAGHALTGPFRGNPPHPPRRAQASRKARGPPGVLDTARRLMPLNAKIKTSVIRVVQRVGHSAPAIKMYL